MKILVFGGHGLVGGHVMKELAKSKQHTAIALSRRDKVDLLNLSDAVKAIETHKPDVIINCAAHVGSLNYVTDFAADVIHDNLQIMLNVYRAVAKVNPKIKVITPISNCAYPGDSDIQKESEFWNGPVHHSVWSYGNSRRGIVAISKCYAMQYKVPCVNFYVANSYGPGDYMDPNKTHALNGMIIRMLQAKQKGDKTFEVWGTGKPTREWVYAPDVARMLVTAVDAAPQVDPINLAQNKAYAIGETARMIKEAISFPGEITFNTSKQDGAPTKQLDDKLFKEKFPQFKFTDMKEGIAQTVAYYRKELGIK